MELGTHTEKQSSINFGLNSEGKILPELNMVDMILNQPKMCVVIAHLGSKMAYIHIVSILRG